jgi:GAF domain-containing protein
VVALPIKLRNQVLGVVDIQFEGKTIPSDVVPMLETITNRLALALENARLFEQTVRRAERERKVLEITSKIRSTNDPQQMLRVALEELQGALKASRAQIVLQPQTRETIPTIGGNGNGLS